MFKSIGRIITCTTTAVTKTTELIEVNLDSLIIISKTGNRYAEQFEQDANIQLAKKRAVLIEQQDLGQASI